MNVVSKVICSGVAGLLMLSLCAVSAIGQNQTPPRVVPTQPTRPNFRSQNVLPDRPALNTRPTQESVFGPANSQGILVPGQYSRRSVNFVGGVFSGRSKKEMQLQNDIRKFTNAVAKAKDKKSEEAASEDLKKALNDLFNERMTYREKEIEVLEKRLKELRRKHDERKQRKDEIVGLKFKTIINKIKGFDF